MSELKYWTPLLTWLSVVADESSDPDADPESKGIYAGVTVTPTIAGTDARAVRVEDLSPTAALLALAPFEARLDDGRLMLRADNDKPLIPLANLAAFPATGNPAKLYRATDTDLVYEWTGTEYVLSVDFARLRLVANCPVLELPDGITIWYEFRFHHVRYNGTNQQLPTITVAAPFIAEDHDDLADGEVEKNLATSEWLNASDAINGEIFVRNVPDDVQLVGDDVQFYAQGSPLGDPLALDVDISVAGLTGATTFMKSMLTGVDDATEARAAIGATSSGDITAAVNALLNGAPGALDTLNELAAALGDDANFATTVTNALAGKASVFTPTAVKTAGYTAAAGELIPGDATAGGFTITLPTAPVDKTVIFVKKLDSTTNPVTIQRGGSDVFNIAGGASSMQLIMQDQTVSLQYKASGGIWYVTSHGTPVAGLDARYLAPTGSGDNLKFTRLLDTNGNKILDLVATAAAINYVRIYNNAGAVGPIIQPGGSANVPLYIALPGTGKLYIWSQSANTPTVAALGSGSNADLLLEGQGTGVVKANGDTVHTATTIHAATSKTTPVDADELALTDSAASFGFKKLTWANLKAAIKAYYDAVASTFTNKSVDLASNTLTGTTAQFNTALSDNDFATLAGTEALSGKTLTSPKMATILDANGNTAMVLSATASAVNYLQVANGASSSGPILQTVGAGTNLSMFLWLKGSGLLYVYSPNNTPTIQGWGPGTNIDLTLTGTGTGKVKAQMAPRVVSTASASSLTPDVSVADLYAYTALAAALTINAPTGSPADGQRLRYRIKDSGSSQTLTFNAIFRALGVTIPAATTAGKVMYIDTVYNAAETVWDVTDVKIQA